MIKVLIAEDEFPLLRGIAKLIEKADQDFSVVMLAKNGNLRNIFLLSFHSILILYCSTLHLFQ